MLQTLKTHWLLIFTAVTLGAVHAVQEVLLRFQINGAVAVGVVVTLPVIAPTFTGDFVVGVGEVVTSGTEVAEAFVPCVAQCAVRLRHVIFDVLSVACQEAFAIGVV